MEAAQKLSEQPEIAELFRVLEGNGLDREGQALRSLMECIEGLEGQLGRVAGELQKVSGQLAEIQDRGLKSTAARIMDRAAGKAAEAGEQVRTVKENLRQAAKNVITAGKEKGAEGLRKAVAAMRIPAVLSRLKESLHRCAEGMEKEAAKMEVVGKEIREARTHRKNIGRILFGREAKEAADTATDKGITAKMEKTFRSCAAAFSRMEQKTEAAMKTAGHFIGEETGRRSVKDELRRMKRERTAAPEIPAPGKEKAR